MALWHIFLVSFTLAASGYVWEWALSTLYHLCQKCRPVLSLFLLVPLGLLVPCYCHCWWHHHLRHWDGGFFCHLQDVLSWRFCLCRRNGRVGRSWACECFYCVGVVRLTGSTAEVGGWSPELCVPLEIQGHCPYCCCFTVPCGYDVTAARRSELCVQLPLMLSSLEVQAQVLWLRVWDHRHHLCCCSSSTCLMYSSPSTFICIDVWNYPASWCVEQRNLCWANGCSNGFRLKGEKQSVFCHHTDTPAKISV